MEKLIILDGGMGTMIQAAGMKPGGKPELFGMEHPDVVEKIHRAYIDAGSDVIYANTFGANSHKLLDTGFSAAQVIRANMEIAKKAAGGRARVALDVGPAGDLLEPLGPMKFDEAYEIFREMVIAGAEAGADLIVIETMTDLYEAKAAVLAAKENTDLPVWVTMSFEKSARTFIGTSVESMAVTLGALGVDAVGINCSLGPEELVPIAEKLMEWTELPVIIKPNAGLPDPRTGEYDVEAEEFAEKMKPFIEMGVSIAGGCCGTDPDFIRALRAAVSETAPRAEALNRTVRRGICSADHVVEFDGDVHPIGERINPTGKKRFQQALREHDLDYIMQKAIEQQDAGAEVLDINVGLPGINEAEMMTDVVKAVQSVVTLPLQIDSPDPAAIEAGLRAVSGRAIVNSVNGEKDKQEQILPLVAKYGAAVVGLTLNQGGLPETAEERIAIAEDILETAVSYGIPKDDVMIDCLTLTISAQQEQAMETLKAVRYVHEELGLHSVLGVSNISFGLPVRKYITSNFLIQAMHCGLDFPIINPNQKAIMDAVYSYRALSGFDADCGAYIERFAEEEAEIKRQKKSGGGGGSSGSSPKKSAGSGGDDGGKQVPPLENAIYKGLASEAENVTRELLETTEPMEIINGRIIPALDVVGDRYEKEEIFLPQLINSANAACAGLDLIKARIAEEGGESVSRGTILLATVRGDIHDIGKNIVKVVLENYGYNVIDLGRDVEVERVVDMAVKEDIRLVGLSALMTTTVPAMRETIEALRNAGHDCSVMVGGAVLTKDYADEIGADYYAKDAKESADIARRVLS